LLQSASLILRSLSRISQNQNAHFSRGCYGFLLRAVKIDPRWLTRVILGKNISAENRSVIQKWAEELRPRLPVATAYYDEPDHVLRLRAM
jgi:hypothetical protein